MKLKALKVVHNAEMTLSSFFRAVDTKIVMRAYWFLVSDFHRNILKGRFTLVRFLGLGYCPDPLNDSESFRNFLGQALIIATGNH